MEELLKYYDFEADAARMARARAGIALEVGLMGVCHCLLLGPNYGAFGASDERFITRVRPPRSTEKWIVNKYVGCKQWVFRLATSSSLQLMAKELLK